MGATTVSGGLPTVTHRVTVLTGGSTPERDVALAGATQVVAALREQGFTVTVVDTVTGALSPEAEAVLLTGTVDRVPPTHEELAALSQRDLGPRLAELPEIRDADVVFPVLHGREGEGGQLQALLELARVPFTGSDSLGSGIAMAKEVSKSLLRGAGLRTPDWVVWPGTEKEIEQLGLPLVVKPSRVGSTIGLSVIDSLEQLADAVAMARTYDHDVLLESFVQGRELTVGVLGKTALAVGEIIPAHDIFDYECKYTPGLSEEIFPADLSDETTEMLQAEALAAHQILRLRDMSRVDFILTADNQAYCLEANTLPGFTQTSLLPQSAAAAGVGFGEMCRRLCTMALSRADGTKLSPEGF